MDVPTVAKFMRQLYDLKRCIEDVEERHDCNPEAVERLMNGSAFNISTMARRLPQIQNLAIDLEDILDQLDTPTGDQQEDFPNNATGLPVGHGEALFGIIGRLGRAGVQNACRELVAGFGQID